MHNPDFKLSTAVMNILQVHYEGGLEQFNQDGGQVAIIPVEDKLGVIVYCPDGIPDELKNTLNGLSEKNDSINFLFPSICNFKDMDDEAIVDIIDVQLRDKSLELKLACIPQINKAVALFTVLNKSIKDEAIQAFEETLRNTQGIYRGCILCLDGSIFIDQSPAVMTPVIQRPDRDTIISKDDILNLNIVLNTTKDINEFIKALG